MDGRPLRSPRTRKWQSLVETYILGQLIPGERNSMQPIASRADVSYEVLQQFIIDSPWDSEKTLDGLIAKMHREVSGPRGVIVIDDSANEKKGEHSPGVAMHCSGLKGGAHPQR
ncbi:MAG: transposase [Halobacteria archaeon]